MSKRNDSNTLDSFKQEQNYSMGSQVAFVPDHTESASFEAYATGDVPKIRHEGHETAQDKIWVHSILEQRDSVV